MTSRTTSRAPRPWRPWTSALLAVAFLGACSGTDDPAGDGGGSDGGAVDGSSGGGEEDVPLLPGQICKPGSVKSCEPEKSKKGLVCNASGTAHKLSTCVGEDGADSMCLNSACTTCFPGVKRCKGEDAVETCSQDGSTWEFQSACNAAVSGQICIAGECQNLCDENVKASSYIGCDYWAVDLDNAFVPGNGPQGFFDAGGAQFAVVVANPESSAAAADVEVWWYENGAPQKVPFDALGTPLPTEPLEVGELRVYKLPRRDVNGTVQAPLAYRVTSSIPIIAFQFNPLSDEEVYSNDASLLIPAPLMGREYFVMSREQTFDILRSYLTVVAILPGKTTVSVQVTYETYPGKRYPDTAEESDIGVMHPGDTRVFELNQWDVLNLETNTAGADPTGSVILADQRVVVFGGSEASNAPNTARCVDIGKDPKKPGLGVCEWDEEIECSDLVDCVDEGLNTCCADHLEHQLFPLKTWGTSYVATKTWSRGIEKDIWRIMAAEDNTKVLTVPTQGSIPILNRGEYFEIESGYDFEIHSSDPEKPLLVGHYLAAEDAPSPGDQPGDAGTGDPAFTLAIPVEQFRHDFVFFVPDEYADNYVNIVTETGAEVVLDGEELPPSSMKPFGSGTFSVVQVRLPEPGTHTVTSSEPAGVDVYGFDQYVSYAYPAGMDLVELKKESPFVTGGP